MPQEKPRRKNSIRLDGFDYSQPGVYFVTVCVRGKVSRLGEVRGGEIHLSSFGSIARECWISLENRYDYLELDEWIMMPNHLHGIILYHEEPTIEQDRGRGGSRTAPTKLIRRKPLGRIIGVFKTTSTKRINQNLGALGGKFWQRGYYDRIIRDQKELDSIRSYINENPLKWEMDEYHPSRLLE
jgi:REP element-mobilizing transposase RayT